jgi:hypothetical protein
MALRCLALFCWATGVLAMSACPALADDPVDFNRQIRPILSDNCFKCHGPDEAERQAGLRVDTPAGIVAALDSGTHAVVAGNSAASELVSRISSADADLRMPPPESGKTLSPAEIELLRRWVDRGATWQGHWSFEPPVRIEPPVVGDETQVRGAIDRFVLARLKKEGLGFSPPADKTTLVRRVTFDLTGLPPTIDEVSHFLADDSPEAYERLVDRLLASPRYGEHMTRYWLDVARYGDTHGLHLDNERALWKYREWVIRAFNENKPFDEFALEQIAGDLLPEATLDQKIATGFNRCNVSTGEGGSINEEVRVRYAVDRTSTLSTVFLGLTVGCAVCHDHKFDPITQKEFYQLFAFYGSTADAAMDGNALSPPPIVRTPSAEQTQQLAELDEQLAALKQKQTEELAKVVYAEPAAAEASTASPQEFVWIEDSLPTAAQPAGNSPWEFVAAPDHPVYSGKQATRRTAQGISQHYFTGATPGLKIGSGDKLFAYVYLDPTNPPQGVMLQFNDGSWEHRAVWGEPDAIPWGAANTPARVAAGDLPETGKWVRLEIEAEKVGLASGTVLNGWAFTQSDGLCYWDKAGIVSSTPQEGQSFVSQKAWEAYERTQKKSALPQPVQEALKVAIEGQTDAQKKTLRDHFVQFVYPATKKLFEPMQQEIDAKTKRRAELEAAIPTSMIMADMPTARDTFVLIRGQYDKHGEKVLPGTPKSLPPMPEGAPANRLGLAQWIVDPGNPLMARVTVNRFWQHYFGQGIVKTSEDFGVQGDWPSHPALLDWLATEFVGSGWDIKHLQKLIVMSATYRQDSSVSPEMQQRDPENKLLARGARFRLDAEVVRDAALAASGLLVEELGGKSVKPYQPAGLWKAVSFRSSNTGTFKRDDGQALYRRSMYTFWKRTSPPPSMTTFDAPSRETCVTRRARTNTPLQALALMNDEQYVEASRKMAARMLTAGTTSEEQLGFGFQLVTARLPNEAELAVLTELHAVQLAHYTADKDAASKLLAVGEAPRDEHLAVESHAAMTMMANLLLNLDEAITKE